MKAVVGEEALLRKTNCIWNFWRSSNNHSLPKVRTRVEQLMNLWIWRGNCCEHSQEMLLKNVRRRPRTSITSVHNLDLFFPPRPFHVLKIVSFPSFIVIVW